MDNGKIIYEKRFPKLTMSDYNAMLEESEIELPAFQRQDSTTFFQNLLKNIVRIVMPERIKTCAFFISMAKQVAEHNEVDTVITEYEDCFVAKFYIGNDNTSFGLKKLIEYSDTVNFGYEEKCAVISVNYYTHAIYRNGKRVAPDNEMDFLI